MPRERRPTDHVLQLVRQTRVRVVIPVQAAVLIMAGALVWGFLSRTHPSLAIGIISFLVVCEIVLLVVFLKQEPSTDEEHVRPLRDTLEEMVLSDPSGGTLVFDRMKQEICARDGSVRVPTQDIRSLMLDPGPDARLLAATKNDLIILSEIRDSNPRERQRMEATGRLLARAAALPFGEEG